MVSPVNEVGKDCVDVMKWHAKSEAKVSSNLLKKVHLIKIFYMEN